MKNLTQRELSKHIDAIMERKSGYPNAEEKGPNVSLTEEQEEKIKRLVSERMNEYRNSNQD